MFDVRRSPFAVRRAAAYGIRLTAIALLLLGCHRETRDLIPTAAAARRTVVAPSSPYEGNAWAITQGQQLFTQYNCAGCHFHGGGGIGPALMDEEWIYGSSPADVYKSIAEGRPNGMPGWGGRIPDHQIWQLTAYVRSLAELEPPGATPARSEEMQAKR